MRFHEYYFSSPRIVGIICASMAVALGLCYLAVAGAPLLYSLINIGAFIISLSILAISSRLAPGVPRLASAAIMAIACILLATALFGNQADGAARWLFFAGLSVQPSLILLPLAIGLYARNRDRLSSLGIVIAAFALALQPDRAMAGMLAVSIAVMMMFRSQRQAMDRHLLLALVTSIASFAVTLVRADTLPAVTYVDQILYSSFDIHIALGAALLTGLALLLLPASWGWYRDPANRDIYAVFMAVWLAAIAAAVLGNYPTPVVGYGGSAIIGYVFSLLSLPKKSC